MSNKFDAYDDNDEITLSSSKELNNKTELQKENGQLKRKLEAADIKIKDYEEIISKNNIKEIIPVGTCNLTEDDIFNITHNKSVIITEY